MRRGEEEGVKLREGKAVLDRDPLRSRAEGHLYACQVHYRRYKGKK